MINSLLADIQTTIGNVPSNLTTSSLANDVYEVYLFTLVLKAAQNEGATIRILNPSNQNPSTLYFRTSPGHLTSNAHDYTYAEILFSDKPPLEAHVSIKISGRSTVLHECDICVLHKSEADWCRRASSIVAPRASKVVLNVEAKFYTTSLSLHLGRSFLGLVTDLSTSDSFFITNTSSTSIEKLLSHRKKPWEHKIKPGNSGEITRLVSAFQNVFKNFKAKY